MAVVLDGSGLTVERLERIARGGEKVELRPDSLGRIWTCRAMLEDKVRAHEIMYGEPVAVEHVRGACPAGSTCTPAGTRAVGPSSPSPPSRC